MLNSLSAKSIKQYNSALKKWWVFCKSRTLNPLSSSIKDIITFLTELFNNGSSYGSLNCTRSAIALLYEPEVGQTRGENSNIRRFFKGVGNIRPPQKKYDSTWDPKIVLNFISQWTCGEETSLEQLSKKLVTLLALVTGQRMQTLSLIDTRDIQSVDDHIEIKIPGRIKTSGPRRMQPTLILPRYRADPSVCPAYTLECYVQRTEKLRKQKHNLFISFRRPYKTVSPQTLSRWVKDTLHKSGIDTNVFSAHSTRHASTSAASRRDINIDIIRKAAGWSENSDTFAKFYKLDIVSRKDTFAKAVIE